MTAPLSLSFEFQDAGGLQARKVFHFQPQGYILTYSSEIRNGAQALNPVVLWGPGLGDSIHVAGEKSSFTTYVQSPQPILLKDGKVERIADPAASSPSHQGTFPFAGIDDHYFIAMAVQPGLARVTYQPVLAPMPGQPELQRDMMALEVLFAKPPTERAVLSVRRTSTCSRASTATSSRTSTSASSRFLAVPLLRALKWINGYVGNYGWSIIILTVLINVADVPAAAQERRLDAEDAGAAAADEGDPGSLRQDEGDRSRASEDEAGD